MTVQEQAARDALLEELTRLRTDALHALDLPDASRSPATIPNAVQEIARSLSAGPYHYRAGPRITIVCGSAAPATCGNRCPTRIRWIPTSSICTAILGSRRALGIVRPPAGRQPHQPCRVPARRRAIRAMTTPGIWSRWAAWTGTDATSSVLDRLQLPVKQVSRLDEDEPGDAYFEVTEEDGRPVIHRPRLDESDGREDSAGGCRSLRPGHQPVQPEALRDDLQWDVWAGHLWRCPGTDR